MAIEGMTEMSGPCEPSAMPLPQPGDDRRPVAALAVHQHQRVVGGQVAQVRRPHDGRRVADRLRVDVEGRDDCPELADQVPAPLPDQIRRADDVHGHGGLGDRARRGAAAHDHDGLGDHRQLELEGALDRLAGGQLHRVGEADLESGTLGRERVGAGLEAQLVGAGRIRRGRHLVSGGGIGRRHRRARNDQAGIIQHLSADGRRLLGARDPERRREQHGCQENGPS